MTSPVEKVAEALCRSENPLRPDDDPDAYEWDIKAMLEPDSEDGDYYRRMAQAAIDALGLTEEQGVQVTPPGGPLRMEGVTHSERTIQLAHDYPERFRLVTRLVGEWTQVGD